MKQLGIASKRAHRLRPAPPLPARSDASLLHMYLLSAPYPSDKQGLLAYAARQELPTRVVAALQRLPEGHYDSSLALVRAALAHRPPAAAAEKPS